MPPYLYPNVRASGSAPRGWVPTKGGTLKISLQALLSPLGDRQQQIPSFALLCLGVVESLASGLMGATDAVRLFFHAENCLFVRKELKDEIADQFMSHGVQLVDLFDALPAEEAQQKFQRELAAMHSLCLELLKNEQIAA